MNNSPASISSTPVSISGISSKQVSTPELIWVPKTTLIPRKDDDKCTDRRGTDYGRILNLKPCIYKIPLKNFQTIHRFRRCHIEYMSKPTSLPDFNSFLLIFRELIQKSPKNDVTPSKSVQNQDTLYLKTYGNLKLELISKIPLWTATKTITDGYSEYSDINYTVPAEGNYYFGCSHTVMQGFTNNQHYTRQPPKNILRIGLLHATSHKTSHENPSKRDTSVDFQPGLCFGIFPTYSYDYHYHPPFQIGVVQSQSRPPSKKIIPQPVTPTENQSPLFNSLLHNLTNTFPRPIKNPKRIVLENDTIHDLLECPLCHSLISSTESCKMTSCCDQLFCTPCLLSWLKKNSKCPKCEIHAIQLAPKIHRYCQVILSKIKVTCQNNINGCPQILSPSNLEQHERDCQFCYISCPQCKSPILKVNLENHSKVCACRKSKCPKCEMLIEQVLLDTGTHFQFCDSVAVNCPRCKQAVLKKNLQKHIISECSGTT